jgi:hypothetical protein
MATVVSPAFDASVPRTTALHAPLPRLTLDPLSTSSLQLPIGHAGVSTNALRRALARSDAVLATTPGFAVSQSAKVEEGRGVIGGVVIARVVEAEGVGSGAV